MGLRMILLLGLALIMLIDCGQGVSEINEQSLNDRTKNDAFPVGLLKTTLRPINNRRHNKRHCDCKGHLAAGKGSTTSGCQCNPEKRKLLTVSMKHKINTISKCYRFF
ncbi:hypothetical protein CHARACLAT_006294 [Characodon lateralis]|uniref:Uncharacterized protein n=1 Tax=Characodon lateralis TaxID=208331 RepID=A0ABU7E7G7_9TELE|nr:hypothetical protein [Characodon lateralis]